MWGSQRPADRGAARSHAPTPSLQPSCHSPGEPKALLHATASAFFLSCTFDFETKFSLASLTVLTSWQDPFFLVPIDTAVGWIAVPVRRLANARKLLDFVFFLEGQVALVWGENVPRLAWRAGIVVVGLGTVGDFWISGTGSRVSLFGSCQQRRRRCWSRLILRSACHMVKASWMPLLERKTIFVEKGLKWTCLTLNGIQTKSKNERKCRNVRMKLAWSLNKVAWHEHASFLHLFFFHSYT